MKYLPAEIFKLDGMVDLTNVILGYNPDRLWDVYGFVGPTMNISKAMNVTYNEEVGVSPSKPVLS